MGLVQLSGSHDPLSLLSPEHRPFSFCPHRDQLQVNNPGGKTWCVSLLTHSQERQILRARSKVCPALHPPPPTSTPPRPEQQVRDRTSVFFRAQTNQTPVNHRAPPSSDLSSPRTKSLLSRVESCTIPSSHYVIVSSTLLPGSNVATVPLARCDLGSTRLSSSDPSFTVSSSGVIRTETTVSVSSVGRTFSVWARDGSGPGSEMVVHLVHVVRPGRKKVQEHYLKRFKRRWSPPPFNILENLEAVYPKRIDMIVSDSEAVQKVFYTISGPGVDQPPIGVFSLNKTGTLFLHKKVDREEHPQFILIVRVFNIQSGAETDAPLPITIEVDDVNDNAPTFKDPLQFTVAEKSAAGTVVGKVNGVDRDQAGSLHVKIRYSLKTGMDLFAINPATGIISTVTNTLDRELKDKHLVVVEIKDMDGAVTGLFNTGTATITVGDINDNAPTFSKTSYTADVKENESGKLVLRIPVEDKDLKPTANWISKFVITKGNENGHFRIETDPKTNDGLLYVAKPLDHEKNPNVHLEIAAQNEADLAGGAAAWMSVPVVVTVLNEDEGPVFSAPTVRFSVKENIANGSLIGSYIALDPETKSSSGIKYYKILDPASWVNVDKNNGELRVANTIDRESHFVQDGIYNITMRAVDASAKTGTGTVIIVVEDVNDNMPAIPTSELILCEKEGELGSIVVAAEDNDDTPFSSPFSFSLPSDHDGTWSVASFNDTAATLQQRKELPTGRHLVKLDVKDLQGSGLLLAFFCTTKKQNHEFVDVGDSGGILLKSNIESPGEEVDSSLINIPITGTDSMVKGSVKGFASGNQAWLTSNGSGTLGTKNGLYNDVVTSDMDQFYSSQYNNQYGAQSFGGNYAGNGEVFDNRHLAQDTTLIHNWQTNGRYLHEKLGYFGTEEDGRFADDIAHAYGFEGVGSAAGSVGCCSDFGDDDDNLDFLSTLGPKFKTLGEVCRKT
ncbi:Desmocollin-3 [Liparis tanakae]|uniref:Desmocollin-3 n=1 Tax=Liparis tanakae TaxID=230148 RepID=A0A4Z2H5T2_9TELE|nr:Desmocollin-3 [Liparis tanakae]